MIDLTEINISPDHFLIVRCELPAANAAASLVFSMSNIKEEMGASDLMEFFASPEIKEAIRTFLDSQSRWLTNGRESTFDVCIKKNFDDDADSCAPNWPDGKFTIFKDEMESEQ